jgi:hypothetical protein
MCLLYLAVLLGALVRPGSASGLDVAQAPTARFEIVCHESCPPRLLAMAASAAEGAWQETIALLGVPHPSLDAPFRIHLYASLEAWLQVEEELTGGRFSAHRSFAHGPTRSAHVALHPDIPPALLARFGPTPRTLRLVAHEAFHLVSTLALPASPLLPEWLAEGAATWIEQRVSERLGWSRGLSDDPIPSTYLWTARRLLQEGRLPPVRRLLEEEDHHSGPGTDYALPMLLVTHLREERPEDLDAILEVASTLRPGDPEAEPLLARAIHTALGGPDFDGLDRSFRTFLAARRPLWVEFSRTLETVGNSWVQVGSAQGALAWRTDPVPGIDLVLDGVVEFPGGGTGDWMRVVLGETGGGRAELRVDPLGGVRLLRFPPGSGIGGEGVPIPPDTLSPDGGPRGPGDRPGADPTDPGRTARRAPEVLPFRIAVSEGGVAVESRGVTLFQVGTGTLTPDGSWGLGTGPGAAVVWHNLRVSPGGVSAAAQAR